MFATLYFKYSTTDDYTNFFNCAADEEFSYVVGVSIVQQKLKDGGVWCRFASRTLQSFDEDSVEEFEDRVNQAIKIFHKN
jgi:hypothetical protein